MLSDKRRGTVILWDDFFVSETPKSILKRPNDQRVSFSVSYKSGVGRIRDEECVWVVRTGSDLRELVEVSGLRKKSEYTLLIDQCSYVRQGSLK